MIYLLVLVVVIAAALLAYGAGGLLHLQGTPLIVLVVSIVLAGLVAAVAILVIHLRAKKRRREEAAGSGGESELDLLLDDANRKLRTAQHQGPKSLNGLPLLYLLGEAGSAKTTIVLRSGLDPELIAGSAPREGDVSPTPLLNLWFTRQVAILEAGQAIRQSANMLARLIERTLPKAYRSTFGSSAPVRAAVVCVSAEQFLVADAPTSSLAAARAVSTQLREISRLLGAALPVYVVVTKLDRVLHFDEYVRHLSNDEAQQILGRTVARSDASAGVYADKVSRELGSALDSLTFALAEFRVEMLDRETEPKNVAGIYEFPREFGKLRKNLSQYLLELCKPSQLSANPYLRGVYFTGVRALMVDQVVGAAPAPLQSEPAEVGATRIFSPRGLHSPGPPATPVRVSTRAPQWAFLSRLFPQTILGDKSALSTTQQTAPARLFRRILFASLAVIFALCTAVLLVSYLNNLALENQLLGAAQALPVSTGPASVPTLNALIDLDQLRRAIIQLDGYQHNGPPWNYRFGLYQGDRLLERARRIYWDRFRPMLLDGAQANIVSYLRGLPNVSANGADYGAAYNPLKGYLMTTKNPERSVPLFLSPLLLQYWTRASVVDPAQSQLVRQQFEFYANELLRHNPYAIEPDVAVVAHARTYLASFGAEQRIYEEMKTAAEKSSPAIDFNRLYPNAAPAIVEPHIVSGAFTRSGFSFMHEAIQHPDRYFQGETWVLGDQAASSLDTANVTNKLAGRYSSDYIKEWHDFLAQARVANCGPLRDEPAKLSVLTGPDSPILEFFYTVSSNTAVADPQIKTPFQPTQALVDPNVPTHFIGPGNKTYVDALSSLSGAVNQFNQNPDTSKDALNAAVQAAGQAVQQTAEAFNVDPQMHTERTVIALLGSPIKCVVPPPPPPPPGPPTSMCTVLGKFPFVHLSKAQATRDLTNGEQASLDEVNANFAPTTGKLWTYYNDNLKQWLVLQGTQYVLAPNAEGHVGETFARFFNHVARISSMFYQTGAPVAGFNFTLRAIPSKGIENATLVVDGQRIPDGSTSQPFKWNAAVAHQASLAFNATEELQMQGTWSLFQLVSMADVTRTPGGLELEFPIQVSGRQTYSNGTPVVVRFELTGPGAEALAPGELSVQPCVMSVIK